LSGLQTQSNILLLHVGKSIVIQHASVLELSAVAHQPGYIVGKSAGDILIFYCFSGGWGGEKQGTETSYMGKSWDTPGREPVLGLPAASYQ
jgi:hypothetical protein